MAFGGMNKVSLQLLSSDRHPAFLNIILSFCGLGSLKPCWQAGSSMCPAVPCSATVSSERGSFALKRLSSGKPLLVQLREY